MKLFDAHLHIIAPGFPLVANHGYLPPFFTTDDYRRRLRGTDLPSTRAPRAYRDQDLALLIDSLPLEHIARIIHKRGRTSFNQLL